MPKRSKSRSRSTSKGANQLTFFLIAAGMGIGAYFVLSQLIAVKPLLVWVGAWTIVGLLFYWWDKSQSQRGGWRVPEMVLHGLALVGGFIGCWAGMFLFRHKTQKPEFKLVLIAATLGWGFILLNMFVA